MPSMTISFTLDNERDHDLVAWLRSQGSRGRSAAIRDTLRQGLAGSRPLTVSDIRQVVRSELAGHVVRSDGPDVDLQSPEPEQAAANLDDLSERLEEW